jgi:hypothetical protein
MTDNNKLSRSRKRFNISYAYRYCHEQISAADVLLFIWWEWIEQQRSVRSFSAALGIRVDEFGDPALIFTTRGTDMRTRYRKAEDINICIMQLEDKLWKKDPENRGKNQSWQLSLVERWCQVPYLGGDAEWRKCLKSANKSMRHWDVVRIQVWRAVKNRGLI